MTTLITGANRGIGLGLLQAAAAAGEPVIGTHRGPPPVVDGAEWMPLDLTDPRAPAALARRLEGRPLELLVCNSGIYPDRGRSLGDPFPSEDWAQTFAVNVTGVFLTVEALLPNLLAGRAPRVAIIASQMGSSERARGSNYIYRASKAAAINLGRNLAVDLAPRGVAVGIYHPGWVRTDMGGAGADIDIPASVAGLRDRFAELTLEGTGRFLRHDGAPHPF